MEETPKSLQARQHSGKPGRGVRVERGGRPPSGVAEHAGQRSVATLDGALQRCRGLRQVRLCQCCGHNQQAADSLLHTADRSRQAALVALLRLQLNIDKRVLLPGTNAVHRIAELHGLRIATCRQRGSIAAQAVG